VHHTNATREYASDPNSDVGKLRHKPPCITLVGVLLGLALRYCGTSTSIIVRCSNWVRFASLQLQVFSFADFHNLKLLTSRMSMRRV
jgi:hypothetical protein